MRLNSISNKNKHSQAELITTVLIILISIAAIALIATFVFNLVKKNLSSTDCFQTAAQIEINTDYSHFNSSSNMLYVSVKRADKDFNLTGLKITYGNEKSSKAVSLTGGSPLDKVYNLLINGSLDMANRSIVIPSVGVSKAYAIDTTGSGLASINRVSIRPVLAGGKECDETDSETIASG